jgi:hypothetical protein
LSDPKLMNISIIKPTEEHTTHIVLPKNALHPMTVEEAESFICSMFEAIALAREYDGDPI